MVDDSDKGAAAAASGGMIAAALELIASATELEDVTEAEETVSASGVDTIATLLAATTAAGAGGGVTASVLELGGGVATSGLELGGGVSVAGGVWTSDVELGTTGVTSGVVGAALTTEVARVVGWSGSVHFPPSKGFTYIWSWESFGRRILNRYRFGT